ncbi:hypothetical protein D3C72_2231010 [compost metagenome]
MVQLEGVICLLVSFDIPAIPFIDIADELQKLLVLQDFSFQLGGSILGFMNPLDLHFGHNIALQ